MDRRTLSPRSLVARLSPYSTLSPLREVRTYDD
jgi:hypothetical protein